MNLASIAALTAGLAAGQSLTGVWDATVVSGAVTVPFKFELSTQGTSATGWFFNGQERTPSTSGRFENGSLVLNFAHLGTKLEASWKDGVLNGVYRGDRVTGTLPFRAEPAKAVAKNAASAPSIAGEWEIPVKSGKGEAAWRFLVRQDGGDVSATILRVDGDTGMLSGAYRDGKFVLSHFSGARAGLLEIQPNADGSLALTMNARTRYIASRPAAARAQGLAAPTDPDQHTRVKNPSEPFRFAFRDLNGKMVSQEDPRFRNKVVVVSLLGSWCPNCRDEAPYLEELYKRYRDQGLEMVGLAFEEEEQISDPVRLRAYVESYGITYPVLLCGEPSEASAKLPQLENFNAWPTILVLGRDGRFRAAHAGFPSEGSGDVYVQTKQDIARGVERLLAEKLP